MKWSQVWTYLFIMVHLSLQQTVPMQFPLTIGGFSGPTVIEEIHFDANNGLTIAGTTIDSSLTTQSIAQKFVMYLPYGASQYLWAVYIPGLIGTSVFSSIATNPTVTQIALLQPSEETIIVLDATNGFFVAAQDFQGDVFSSQMDCTRGCNIGYFGGLLYIFFYSNQNCITEPIVPCTITLADGTSVAASCISCTSYHTYHSVSFISWDITTTNILTYMLSPTVNNVLYDVLIGSSYMVLSIKDASSPPKSTLVAVNPSIVWQSTLTTGVALTNLDGSWSTNMITNDYIFGCGVPQTSLGTVTLSSLTNVFHIFRVTSLPFSSTLSDLRGYIITGPSGSALQCNSMHMTSPTTVYVNVLSVPTSQLILYQITLVEAASSTISYSVSVYLSTFGTYAPSYVLSAMIANSLGGVSFYFAGSDIWGAQLATNPIGSTYYVAFVHNTDSTQSYLNPPFSFSSTSSGSASISTTYTLVTTLLTITIATSMPLFVGSIDTFTSNPMSQPVNIAEDVCLLRTNSDQSYLPSPTFSYFISDTLPIGAGSTPSIALPFTIGACTNVCISEVFDLYGFPYPSSAITQNLGTGDYIVSTTNTGLAGTSSATYTLTYRGILPTTYYSNCVYFFNTFTIQMQFISIISTTIPNYIYYIGQAVPLSITFPLFTLSVANSDPRFDIVYSLLSGTGLAINPPLSSALTYTASPPTLVVSSTDFSLVAVQSFELSAAYQSYFPTYSVYSAFTINFENACATNIISSTEAFGTIYYLIGFTPLVYTWKSWTTTMPVCGVVQYVVSGQPAEVTTTNFVSITVSTLPSTLPKTCQLILTGTVTAGALVNTQSYSFKVRWVSTAVSYITATTVPNMLYYVGDNPISMDFSLYFDNTDPTLTVVYSMGNTDGVVLASNVFAYNVTSNTVTLQTSDKSFIGVYDMIVTAEYLNLAGYSVSSTFLITMLDGCTRNQITAPRINSITYNIGDIVYTQFIPPWVQSMSSCGQVKYQAQLKSGQALPMFLQFSSQMMQLTVYTFATSQIGQYQVQIVGATNKYDVILSQIVSSFTVTVACATKSITSPDSTFSEIAFVGTSNTVQVTFDDFTISPLCPNTSSITYQATLNGGDQLPSFITFTPSKKLFSINSANIVSAGNFEIQILGSVAGSSVQGSLSWVLQAVNPPSMSGTFFAAAVSLTTINVKVLVEKQVQIQSVDFSSLYGISNYLYIPDNNAANFSSFVKLVLTVSPGKYNMGYYTYYFYAITSSQKYLQTVNVNVYGGSSSLSKDQNALTAVIYSISRSGSALLQFSNNIINYQNANAVIDGTVLQVTAYHGGSSSATEVSVSNMISMTWSTVAFTSNNTLELALNFADPMSISQNVTYLFINRLDT